MYSQGEDLLLLAVVLGQPGQHFNYNTNYTLECCYAKSIVNFSLHFASTQMAAIERRGGRDNDR